jgi:N-acetylmuramoyl-L-alanine amidase
MKRKFILLCIMCLMISFLPIIEEPTEAASHAKAQISVNTLNVRSGPGLSNTVVAKVHKGQTYVITSEQGQWLKLQLNSHQSGWVAGWLVKKLQTEETATVKASSLNVRSGPSTAYRWIGSFSKGDSVSILNENNGWYEVSFQGSKGWISGSYIKKEANIIETDRQDVNRNPNVSLLYDGTNIRKGPSTNYSVVARGNQGERFSIVNKTGDWYEIQLSNGSNAFVAGWIVTLSGQLPEATRPALSSHLKGKTIVIDPGHGGIDSGAIGFRHGTLEKRLNLETAKLAAAKLKSAGAKVVLTRSDDRYLTLPFRVGIAHQYDADAFISLHYNSSFYPGARGINSFYYNRQQEYTMANTLQQELVQHTGLYNRGVRAGNYHVLRTNRQPSILLELGFLSNFQEEYTVRTKDHQEKVSQAILTGLTKYFDQNR